MSTAGTLGLPRWASVTEWFRRSFAQRNGRRALIAIGSVAGAIALGAGLLYTDLFAVERIDVTGNSRISHDAVVERAGIELAMPIVSVDEVAIRKKLLADPWVENATVTSHWPHAVDIAITERRPLFQAQTKTNKWAELGAGGVVLSVNDGPTNGLPVALNTTVEPRAGAQIDASARSLADVSAALPDSLREQTKQLLQDQSGIKLGLASNVIVIVGSPDDLANKLTSAAAILRTVDQKTIETLDVTSPTLPVTKPRVKATPAAPSKTTPTTTAPSSTRASQTTTTSVTRQSR